MDSPIAAVLACALALPAGWLAASHQHRLYREPEFRAEPLAGAWGRLARPVLAVAFAAVGAAALRPGHYTLLPATLAALAGWGLVVLASTDLERRRLPNRLVYPGFLFALAAALSWPDRDLLDALAGAGAGLAIAAAMFALGVGMRVALRVSGDAFGMGDAKLIVLLGALVGWPALLSALLLGIIAGGIPAIALLAAGRHRAFYSYGPFLAVAGLAVLLWPGGF